MKTLTLALAMLAFAVPVAHAQVQTIVPSVVPGAARVIEAHVKVHSVSLEGNLEGEPADRDVIIYLPPDYEKQPKKRYPVVYALHGYFLTADKWSKEIHTPQTVEGAFALGAKDMIVVLPSSWTIHNGSMYSNSVTTGNFEGFIAHDLVAYIDSHYRTIANRESRGLVGHSMGGYGATRIGMKYPEVFGALYIMSPCCLSARGAPAPEVGKQLEAITSLQDATKADLWARTNLAAAAAWSPNPKNPPLFVDLPTKDGEPQPDVLAKWAANAPLDLIDQYVGNLRQYRAIAIDVGDQDGLNADTKKLHDLLDRYGIANHFELYSGTHTSAVADRFQNHVLPFFSQNLVFGQ